MQIIIHSDNAITKNKIGSLYNEIIYSILPLHQLNIPRNQYIKVEVKCNCGRPLSVRSIKCVLDMRNVSDTWVADEGGAGEVPVLQSGGDCPIQP